MFQLKCIYISACIYFPCVFQLKMYLYLTYISENTLRKLQGSSLLAAPLDGPQQVKKPDASSTTGVDTAKRLIRKVAEIVFKRICAKNENCWFLRHIALKNFSSPCKLFSKWATPRNRGKKMVEGVGNVVKMIFSNRILHKTCDPPNISLILLTMLTNVIYPTLNNKSQIQLFSRVLRICRV